MDILTALPSLGHHDVHNIWYPSPTSQSYHSPHTSSPSHNLQQNRQSSHHRSLNQPVRTTLSVLRQDENAIELRKANIRRFGAGWLKPAGVSKTLQGMLEEKAEREEAEATRQREMETFDLMNDDGTVDELAEAETADQRSATGMIGPDDEDGAGRDLDADIPDADDAHEDWEDEDQDQDQGVPQEGDVEEGDGDRYMEGAEDGVDLDEDIPEADSYQHTDTDVEDESEIVLGMGSRASESVGNRESLPTTGPVRDGGGAVDSSFLNSSPAAHRLGGRRSGGSTRRYSGREN